MLTGCGLAVLMALASADAPLEILVRQLDDPSFLVRQEADRGLRHLGMAVAPKLRLALRGRPSLEVARRLEGILRDLSPRAWHDKLEPAQAEARRTGKPILIISTYGKLDEVYARSGRELQSQTLADLDVTLYLSQNFVAVWHDTLPDGWYGSAYVWDDLARQPIDPRPYREGRGQGTLHSFFCTPDGRVMHALEGFWGPERFLREARLARSLFDKAGSDLNQLRLELAGQDSVLEYAATGTPVEAALDHRIRPFG